MLVLSGVVKTASDRRTQHVHEFVVPRIWRPWLSAREDGRRRGWRGVAFDSPPRKVLLLGLRFDGGVVAWQSRAKVSWPADRQQTGDPGIADPTCGMSRLRSRAASRGELC